MYNIVATTTEHANINSNWVLVHLYAHILGSGILPIFAALQSALQCHGKKKDWLEDLMIGVALPSLK